MIKRIKARIKAERKWPFSVGDKVMFDASKIIDKDVYNRAFYPKDGTIGTVVGEICGCPDVQWPKGATSSLSDSWLCPTHWLKKVEL